MDGKVLLVGPLDRVLYLRTLPALDGLAPAQLAAIAQHARERFFAKGAVLLHPDEPADAFYIVVDGAVALTRTGRAGQVATSGEAVGFLDLLARSAKGMEARAEVDTLALELDWDAQLDLCEDHFPILAQYLRYLSTLSLAELRDIPAGTWLGGREAVADGPARRLNLVERMLALRRSRAFSTCSLDALSELARDVVEVRHAPGEVVWRRGEEADHFVLVASGAVRCAVPEGGWHFDGGAALSLGMHEALSGGRRWYDAVAREGLVGLRIDVEPFLDILEDHFDLAIDFTSVMALRLIELMEGGAISALEPTARG